MNSEKMTLSISEAAEQLGLCRAKVYELANSDTSFPAIRLGEKRLVIPRQALEQWLENRVNERLEG